MGGPSLEEARLAFKRTCGDASACRSGTRAHVRAGPALARPVPQHSYPPTPLHSLLLHYSGRLSFKTFLSNRCVAFLWMLSSLVASLQDASKG